ncbi:MAG TPA: protein-L-isoaspartate O-methyltransferase [Gammaproteobacteria bacterium]|nr:protein-L-isoaspartate O-methyltransferase [Gammaproteobacteria bacterium]
MNQEQARFNMIEQQIRPWNVDDNDVLNIMKQIPREHFVPDNYKRLAFADIQAPLANGQQMMEPKIEARMLQALQIKPGDKVLEIGTGSGYMTACLDWLSDEVTSIEIHEQLSQQAQQHLEAIGISDVNLLVGDVFDAAPDEKFDVIAVTGSLPADSDYFEKMLAVGGRLFQIVGVGPASTAQLITRVREDAFRRENLFETEIAPLENAPAEEAFIF